MKRSQPHRKIAAIALAAALCLPTPLQAQENTRPANATAVKTQDITLADPTIFTDSDSTYYLYGTTPGSVNGFAVYRSKDLRHWTGPVGRIGGYALTDSTAWGKKGFWAPQIVAREGRYYMFYTADEHLAIAVADSPLGPFKAWGRGYIETATKAIDPYLFIDTDGKAYLYHVRLTRGNRIFVARLTDDWTAMVGETLRECVSAQLPWENTAKAEWPVAEGPTVIRMDKRYYLFYSVNDFRNPDYAVAYATAPSPMGPWTKRARVIHRSMIGHNGTGHGDLLRMPDGSWRYVFHIHQSDSVVAPRRTAIVRLTFKKGQWRLAAGSFQTLESDR